MIRDFFVRIGWLINVDMHVQNDQSGMLMDLSPVSIRNFWFSPTSDMLLGPGKEKGKGGALSTNLCCDDFRGIG